MTAFLSIQLVLLFTLMVAGDRRDLPRNGTDDPQAVHCAPMPHANREDAIVISVQRDGRMWLGYQELTSGELSSEIRKAVTHGSERRVYIHADARARYGSVLRVLSAVRSAGIEDIAFFVYERRSPLTSHDHGL
jgi:biopolymer transport protein TolR